MYLEYLNSSTLLPPYFKAYAGRRDPRTVVSIHVYPYTTIMARWQHLKGGLGLSPRTIDFLPYNATKWGPSAPQ